jgi:PAS domain S-box-containing protein
MCSLERREAELRTMVEAVAALLLVLDERGVVVQANPAVAAATGVPVHELIGLEWASEFVPVADHGELGSAFGMTRAGRTGTTLEGRVLCRREGQVEERIIRWRLAGLPGPEGFRIYASGLDVTDVRVLERRTRLAEKLAAVGTFSAGLAHEIRNPLNGATLQLQLLERRLAKIVDAERATPVREPLALVRAELERLSRLVTEFLAFARPAALQARDTDLVATVAQVVELEAQVAAQRHRALELRAPDGPVTVEIDPERIKQIVLNLVRNALDAATSRVIVTVRRDGAGACLCVTDDGPGISAENLARIFEPFFTTKEGGTGLGMAIVHSRTIEIHCDHGTTVSIALQRRVP